MSDIIYKNREEALSACKSAAEEVCRILGGRGVWQHIDDDCLDISFCAEYFDEGGEKKVISYFD